VKNLKPKSFAFFLFGLFALCFVAVAIGTGARVTEDSANLPDPDIIAQEIVEDLQAALAQFAEIAADLKSNSKRIL
jgi:hypothetical protein